MLLSENIRMAFSSLFGNRLRTFLSLLGIMIGVASVVTILNLGRSASESISASFESGGLDTVSIMPRGSARETMVFSEEFSYSLIRFLCQGIVAAVQQNPVSVCYFGDIAFGVRKIHVLHGE